MMSKMQWDDVKKNHCKKFTFLSLPLASRHSAFEFPLMGVSASEATLEAIILKLS